jgi:hypothetical protein
MTQIPEPLRTAEHWSASRFMLFEQCPRAYQTRYLDGVASPPSMALLFGKAMHTALEAMHQGHRTSCLPTHDAFTVGKPARSSERCGCADAACDEDHYTLGRAVFAEQFVELNARLAEIGATAPAALYSEGLRMIDQVAALALNRDGFSSAERWFTLPTREDWGWPTIGAVDLWSPPWSAHGPTVWDFKTTVGTWGPERVLKETWQPMLYAWAYQRAYGVVPTFKYLVLSRVDGSYAILERSWTKAQWAADMARLEFRAEDIAARVRAGDFGCTRGHGTCLECGVPYGHDHVCAEGSRPLKIKLSSSRRGAPPRPTTGGISSGVKSIGWTQPPLDL